MAVGSLQDITPSQALRPGKQLGAFGLSVGLPKEGGFVGVWGVPKRKLGCVGN